MSIGRKAMRGLAFLLAVFMTLNSASVLVMAAPLPQDEITAMDNFVNWVGICGGGGADTQADEDPHKTAQDLTLREKIGQLIFVGVDSKSEAVKLAEKYQIGGIMLKNGTASSFDKSAIDAVKEAGKLPVLVASDEEGGKVRRVGGEAGKYSAKELGGKSNATIKTIAKEYGEKLADLGITVNYAPVLDVDDGRNSIISDTDRAFAKDPDKVADKAGAFAEGMRDAKIVPVFKHFPGHGRANGDSHVSTVKTPHISSLKSNDLKPYEEVLDKGTNGVMVGHLVVPGLTNGKQATISKPAIDLLRDEYKFEGVVFSDEIANMKAITNKYSPVEAVSLAIQAGVDMPLFNHNPSYSSLADQVEKTIDKIENDVKAKQIDEKQIDASLERIAALKIPLKEGNSDPCTCEKEGDENGGALRGGTNAEKAFNFLMDKGLSAKAAAAGVGNLMLESGGNTENLSTTIEAPGTGAHGIAQWTDGRKERLYREGGKKDLGKQLDYLWWEISTEEGQKFALTRPPYPLYHGPLSNKPLIDILKSDLSLAKITVAWEQILERSGVLGQRVQNATKIFEKYGKGAGGGGAVSTSADGGKNCAEGGTGEGTGKLKWPLAKQHPVTSCYGSKARGRLHSGLDIAAPAGTKIMAADGGTVTFAGPTSGFGNTVVIKHEKGLSTLYAHQKDGSIAVKKGEKVDQGQKVGEVNNTGSSFGDHLHFNVQKQSIPSYAPDGSDTEDPLKHLPKDGRSISGGDCP